MIQVDCCSQSFIYFELKSPFIIIIIIYSLNYKIQEEKLTEIQMINESPNS